MHPEKFKILIADKDRDFSQKLQDKLRRHFHHVVVTDTGPEVLRACEKTNFSLVIVGNPLPGILGIELVRRLEQKYSQMKRILTSEYDTDPVIESCLEYGTIDRFLQKPIEINDLAWEVEYLLRLCVDPPHHPTETTSEAQDEYSREWEAPLYDSQLHFSFHR
jgi:DNA-binding response OmpR family regulator